MKRFWPYILIVFLFLLDRFSKIWISGLVEDNGDIVLTSWLTITSTYNKGIAFGWLQGSATVVGVLTIFVIVGFFVFLVQTPVEQWIARLGLALVVGGSLGNWIDRITEGAVFDFVRLSIPVGIFNVADVAINAGMIVFLISTFIYKDEESSSDKTKKSTS